MRHALILLGVGLALVWAGACSDSDTPGRNLNATSSGATTGGDGGAAPLPCVPDCVAPLVCCDGVCANLENDINNCGVCFKSCPKPHGVCLNDECLMAECLADPEPQCAVSEYCCGMTCCPFNDLCCGNVCTPPNENDTCPP